MQDGRKGKRLKLFFHHTVSVTVDALTKIVWPNALHQLLTRPKAGAKMVLLAVVNASHPLLAFESFVLMYFSTFSLSIE